MGCCEKKRIESESGDNNNANEINEESPNKKAKVEENVEQQKDKIIYKKYILIIEKINIKKKISPTF